MEPTRGGGEVKTKPEMKRPYWVRSSSIAWSPRGGSKNVGKGPIEIMCNIFNWNCNLKSACRYDSITENGTTPPGSGHNHKKEEGGIPAKLKMANSSLKRIEGESGSGDIGGRHV